MTIGSAMIEKRQWGEIRVKSKISNNSG